MKIIFRLSILVAILGVTLTGCSKDDKYFVAVSDILDVPLVAELNKPLALTATVLPAKATNKTIVWTVKVAGTTNASITGGNVLTATATGNVILTATIDKGATETTSFTKDFTVSVRTTGEMPVVTDVTVSPSTISIAKGKTQTFTATLTGSKLEKSDKAVYWSVTGNAKTETAISADGTLTVAADETATSLTVKATSAVDNTKNGTAAVRVTEKTAQTDIYAAGYERNGDGKYVGKVWKNGELLHNFTVNDQVEVSSIFVAGNDVYVVGNERIASGSWVATLWKNGTKFYALKTTNNGTRGSYAVGIHVAGSEVYVAGYEYTSSTNTTGYVWKNNEVLYNIKNDNDYYMNVSAMYVSNNDVYVCGTTRYNTNTNYVARVWKNGNQLFSFSPVQGNSGSRDIKVSGNTVYVSGYSGASYEPVIYKYDGNNVSQLYRYFVLPQGAANPSASAISIDVVGNDIYVAVTNSTSADRVYKNNSQIYSLTGAKIAGISVKSENVYIVGYEAKVAKVWRNGEELYTLTDGTYDARATSIFVVEN